MITKNTLFILGAGASAPFGYPTGQKLREIILKNLSYPPHSENTKRYDLFNELGFNEKKISKFIEAFLKSTLYSIDAFLEKRPEFLEMGKVAIADALIPYEIENRLFSINGDWYGYLFNRLVPKCAFEIFAENKISFVTFNYDRSLEHYLFSSLLYTYGKSPEEVIAVMNKIKIIHMYGQLDYLPWQKENGQPYDARRGQRAGHLKSSAEAIRIVHEDVDINRNEVFKEAHKLIKDAKNVYFLGFGYYEMNLDRLKIKDFIYDRNIRGTSLELELSKKQDVDSYFSGPGRVCIRRRDINCMEFLQEEIDFL